MGSSKRGAVVVAIALIAISMYLSIYTLEAYIIAARYISSDSHGEVFWINGPSGSLFPWPAAPGMAEVLSKINGADLFIYTYLIKTWILVGLSALAWVITVWFGVGSYPTNYHDNDVPHANKSQNTYSLVQ